VVDDNRVNRMLLTKALLDFGHSVETANDGEEALALLRSKEFDLVLLDIEMPVMDGYQVLAICLEDTQLRDIPIIMTSSIDELDSLVRCIELGAEDFLNKPLKPVLLHARVKASLEKKRLRDEQRKLFRTFATKEVADELMRTGFSLGGKYIEGTMLFADIRSFSSLSERESPEVIIDLLNNYFALMFEAINGNHGTVNQLVGDGLMSIFGAPIHRPTHAEDAVRAAIQMQQMLREFNALQAKRGKIEISVGIGIATGRVIAGYTGTQYRATYTCVGDTVNLAARIEDYTKAAQRSILIDQTTRERLGPEVAVESIGPVVFKGKSNPTNIYSVAFG
jgi:adenylate cyclase